MDDHDVDKAFDAFVRAHYPSLTRMAFLLCGDWHRAEDATQDGLLRLHRRWRRIDDHPAYARRTISRLLVDEARRPWRRETAQEEIRLEDVEDVADAVAGRQTMVRALQQLTPRRRACIVWRYYLDASVTDTAAALGCSEGNVKRLTSDALAALRGILQTEPVEMT